MIGEEGRISPKVDIRAGTIEIDAPVASFDQAIAKTRELTDSLAMGRSTAPAVAEEIVATAGGPKVEVKEKARAKPSKAGGSSGRAGRIGSFDPIKDLLSEEQQISIRKAFDEKAASEQGDQVLVALYQGEVQLGRQSFGYNEIYTLMWRGGVDPLPKALDVVLQRLMQDQLVEKSAEGFFLKFLGKSRVEKELPTKKDA